MTGWTVKDKLSYYSNVIIIKLYLMRRSFNLKFSKWMSTQSNTNNSNSTNSNFNSSNLPNGNNNNKRRQIFLNIISVIIIVVLIYLFFSHFFLDQLGQLPALIRSLICSFLIFNFVYNKLNFSKNIFIRLLQKFVVYNVCFYFAIMIAVYFDFSLFNTIFCDSDDEDNNEVKANNKDQNYNKNDLNNKDGKDYDFKLPKEPVDILTKAISDAASNMASNMGAASAGGAAAAAVIKNMPLPPVQRIAAGAVAAGVTSGAVTIGIQVGGAITKNLNASEAIKNHPYGEPDIERVPSPDSNFINSALENGDQSIPLVDLLLNLITLNLLELIVLITVMSL